MNYVDKMTMDQLRNELEELKQKKERENKKRQEKKDDPIFINTSDLIKKCKNYSKL